MVEYFSKTEYVICTFRQISEVPDQTYKHSSVIYYYATRDGGSSEDLEGGVFDGMS